MPYCKKCGYELLDPEEDLHDPDNLMQIVEGGVTNEKSHLKVIDGAKGPRLMCRPSGKMTAIVEHPPEEEGEGGGTKEEPEQPQPEEQKEVYELPEDKSPVEVLAEVITSPFLGLNNDQVDEVMDWAGDYNGQIPPDMLESILANMSGVQKQAAALARQKYEVKINKWVQEQARGDEGPPIGVTAQPPKGRGGREGRDRHSGGGGGTEPQPPPDDRGRTTDSLPQNLGRYRRVRRTQRRNNAADKAVETAAEEIARELGPEFAQNFGRLFGLPGKFLEAKIEQDPDWVLEKMEQWDIDLDTFLEPSDARKQEMQEDNTSTVDREADDALEMTKHQHDEEVTEDDFFDDGEENVEYEEEDDGIFDRMEAAPGGGQ